MAKEIELPDGSIGEFPDTMDDAQIQAVLRKQFGGPPETPSLGQKISSGLGQLKSKVQTGINYIDTLGGRLPGTPAGAFIPPSSVNPVPGNLTEAGGQIGQAVIPGAKLAASGLGQGWQALTRVLGPAIGGEAGNQLEGGPTGRGALIQGGGALAGEGGAGIVGKVARSVPGAKGRIAADDAGAYATEMGRQSPPLAGAKTVQDLQMLAQGKGRDALGGAKEKVVQQIEAMTGNAPLSVPSLDRDKNFTVREANDLLSEIGARAFSRNPLDRTFQGQDQRKLYGQVASELDAALGAAHPDAPALFQQAQGDYKKGLALLRPLQQKNAVRLSPTDVQFNTPAIQGAVQEPKNAASMRNKLGDADYEALVNVLTRGAGQGRDVLASGRGGMLDAAMQTIGRGTNSGAMGMLGVPLRTLLPNVGSQYTGKQPYTLPPVLQQALDAVLQRQAGQIGQP